MKFLIVAIFCDGAVCEPVSFISSPRGYEQTDDWCGRYSFGRAVALAQGYIPRVELTLQKGSVHCEPVLE